MAGPGPIRDPQHPVRAANLGAVRNALHELTEMQFEALRTSMEGPISSLGERIQGRGQALPIQLLRELELLTPDEFAAEIATESREQRRVDELLQRYVEAGPDGEEADRQAVKDRILRCRDEQDLPGLDLSGLRISELPDLSRTVPNLVVLNLAGCDVLSSLNGLRDLPNLQVVYLDDCKSVADLEDLRNLPSLHHLYLERCTGLATLEGLHQLPSLQYLNLTGCEALQAPPTNLPAECRVDLPEQLRPSPAGALLSQFSQDRELIGAALNRYEEAPGNLEIARHAMQQEPRTVLSQVAAWVTRNPNQAITVAFMNEPAIDVGGPRKSLWTDLSKRLFHSERSDTHLLGERRGTSEEKPEGDGWMPLLENDADRRALHELGVMMGYGASQRPPLLMASIFDPILFDAVRLRIQGRPDFELVAKLLNQRYSDLLLQDPAAWDQNDVRLLSGTGEALGLDPLPAAPEARSAWINELKQTIVDGNRSRLQMLDALREGLEAGAPGIVQRLTEMSEVQFREAFQGRFDPDSFIKALTCHEQKRLMALPNPSPADQERLRQLNMRMDWFKGWIRHPLEASQGPQDLAQREEVEQKLRRGLLDAMTGRESLLDGEEVFLLIVGSEEPISLHTCFNRLDMPASIDTQDEFRAELRGLARAASVYNAG
jgi:hypothetical protein